MRKFYAFIAAAMVGCAAMSASPIQKAAPFTRLQMGPSTTVQNCELEKISPAAYAKEHNLKPASLETISRAIEEYQQVAGTYLCTYKATFNSNFPDGEEANISVDLTQQDNIVTFYEFPFTDFFPFDMTMSLYTDEDDPTFSIYQLECPGMGQTVIWQNPDGEDVGWFLCAIQDGAKQVSYYRDDICFFIFEDKYGKPVLMIPYNGYFGLAYGVLAEGGGLYPYSYYIMDPQLWSCNGVSKTQEFDFDTQEFFEAEYPFYAAMVDADEDDIDDSVMIYLLNGMAGPVAFFCDKTDMTFTDYQLPVFVGQDNAGNEYEFYMFAVDEEGYLKDEPISGPISADAGNCTVMDLGTWVAYCTDLENGTLAYFEDNVLNFEFNVFGEEYQGINSIAVDNTNAPVEFYNIQGMRLSAPAKGQMVIVKQGNSVKKMIIK